jgi:mannosyltransferase
LGVVSLTDPTKVLRHRKFTRWLPALVGAVVAFGVNLIGLTTPYAWEDEGATWVANQRSVGQLLSMLRGVDAVHGLYYFIVRGWQWVFGDSVFSLRLLSVVAVAAGAALASLLAAELFRGSAQWWVGILYGLLPQATLYAVEARSYVISATAVTAAMLAFWVAARTGRRAIWLLYGILVVFSVHLFLYSALAFLALGVSAFWLPRKALLPGLITSVVALASCVPFARVAWRQSAQVSWLANYTFGPKQYLMETFWGTTSWAAWIGVAATVLATASATWAAREPQFRAPAALVLGWLVLPTALLLMAGWFRPTYFPRYVVFSFPALALLIGWAVSRVRLRWMQWTAAAVVIAACVPSFVSSRQPDAKASVMPAVRLLDEHSQPGDGLYIVKRDVNEVAWAFPDHLGNLTNLSANHGKAWRSRVLSYPSRSLENIEPALAAHSRVWVFAVKYYDIQPVLTGLEERGFVQAEHFQTTSGLPTQLVLMERRS